MPRPTPPIVATAFLMLQVAAPAAWAQPAAPPPAPAPPPAAPAPAAPAPAAPAAPPAAAAQPQDPAATTPVAPETPTETPPEEDHGAPASAAEASAAPVASSEPAARGKPLQISVGLPPSALDLGSEADILGVRDSREMAAMLDRWAFSMKGSIRAPLRVGFGRRNDGQEGIEMHALPRVVGLGSGDWNYLGLAPNASVSLTVTVANPVVSGTIIMGTSHLWDASYPVIDDVGLDQGYLTFKFPNAFGNRGGIALTAGIFSERFGTSGPFQKSSGYYSTYLFGRTHQAGESLTFDVDITPDLELILENGVGARVEQVPFIVNSTRFPDGPAEADFFPGQQSSPYGSTFVHHSHGALQYEEWLRVSGHFMQSWTPDDNTMATGQHVEPGRMTVLGGDIHYDKELFNGFVGYSHVDAQNLYPLGDAINVLHSGSGRAFKLNYFGQKNRFTGITPSNFGGTLDTILWQFMLRVAPLIGDPFGSRDLNVATYGMYNHAVSPKIEGDMSSLDIDDHKLKFGVDIDLSLLKFMSVGTRLDRVIPRLDDDSDAYTALSPRVSFYTKWKSKEQVIVQYTHFFLGKNTVPGSPYTDEYFHPDPDMLVIMGRMSF